MTVVGICLQYRTLANSVFNFHTSLDYGFSSHNKNSLVQTMSGLLTCTVEKKERQSFVLSPEQSYLSLFKKENIRVKNCLHWAETSRNKKGQ